MTTSSGQPSRRRVSFGDDREFSPGKRIGKFLKSAYPAPAFGHNLFVSPESIYDFTPIIQTSSNAPNLPRRTSSDASSSSQHRPSTASAGTMMSSGPWNSTNNYPSHLASSSMSTLPETIQTNSSGESNQDSRRNSVDNYQFASALNLRGPPFARSGHQGSNANKNFTLRPATAGSSPTATRDPAPLSIFSLTAASSLDPSPPPLFPLIPHKRTIVAHSPTLSNDDTNSQPMLSPITPIRHFRLKHGKRFHAFPSRQAPYCRSYDLRAIDHDTWNHYFFSSLCQSHTWHNFEEPPKKVLDLGCGNGIWIIDAARAWPDSYFVGLDLVPLHPDLKLAAPQLADRIKWVIANFLERLPFESDEFDLVHIRRIARGVPEDKWAFLLEEVSRVLKPDGAIEVIEEDLIFPGGMEPCSCHHPPPGHGPHPSSRSETPNLMSAGRSTSTEMAPQPSGGHYDIGDDPESPIIHSYHDKSMSDHSKLEEAYIEMHASRFINLSPTSLLASEIHHYFRDVRSHPPVLVTFPPPEDELWHEDNEAETSVQSQISESSSLGSSAVDDSSVDIDDTNLFALEDGPPTAYAAKPPPGGWGSVTFDARSLINRSQPFVVVDRCRMPARMAGSKVLNSRLKVDLKNLTMHLSQSVVEVLECTEAIWEYLLESGKATSRHDRARKDLGDAVIDRGEFEQWVSRYEREMQQATGMGNALAGRLSWHPKRNLQSLEEGKATIRNKNTTIYVATPPVPSLADPFYGARPSMDIKQGATSHVSEESPMVGAAAARLRTGSAPEKVLRKELGHARTRSLEGPGIWDVVLGSEVGEKHTEVWSPQNNPRQSDLPRLSRSIRVLVAWNNKA